MEQSIMISMTPAAGQRIGDVHGQPGIGGLNGLPDSLLYSDFNSSFTTFSYALLS